FQNRLEEEKKINETGAMKTTRFGAISGFPSQFAVHMEINKDSVQNTPESLQDYMAGRIIGAILKDNEVRQGAISRMKKNDSYNAENLDLDDNDDNREKREKARITYLSIANSIRRNKNEQELTNADDLTSNDKERVQSQLLLTTLRGDFSGGMNPRDQLLYYGKIISEATGEKFVPRAFALANLWVREHAANARHGFYRDRSMADVNSALKASNIDENVARYYDYNGSPEKPVNSPGGWNQPQQPPQPSRQNSQSEIESLEREKSRLIDERRKTSVPLERAQFDKQIQNLSEQIKNLQNPSAHASAIHASAIEPPIVQVDTSGTEMGGVTADSVTAENATTDPEAVQNQYLDALIGQITEAISEGMKEGFTGLDLSKIKVDTGKAQLDASTALAPFQLQSLARVTDLRERVFRMRMLKSLKNIAVASGKKEPGQEETINNEINNIETSIDQSFEKGEVPTVETVIANNPTIKHYMASNPEQAESIKKEINNYINITATQEELIKHDFGPAMEMIRGSMHGIIANSSVPENSTEKPPVMSAPKNIGRGGVAEPTMQQPETASRPQSAKFGDNLQPSSPTTPTSGNRFETSESANKPETSDIQLEETPDFDEPK
ncbi:MAG: hypothetical protein UR93_C0004G0022, partial [Berkelbacteria bacterium GW2011_GWA2_35_9]